MQPWLYFLIFGVLFLLMMRGSCGRHVMGSGHGKHCATPGSIGGREQPYGRPPAEAVDPTSLLGKAPQQMVHHHD